MLIGACDPMLVPIRLFEAFALLPRAWRARIMIVMLIQARARTAMSTGPTAETNGTDLAASGLAVIAVAPVEVLFIIFGYFDTVSKSDSDMPSFSA